MSPFKAIDVNAVFAYRSIYLSVIVTQLSILKKRIWREWSRLRGEMSLRIVHSKGLCAFVYAEDEAVAAFTFCIIIYRANRLFFLMIMKIEVPFFKYLPEYAHRKTLACHHNAFLLFVRMIEWNRFMVKEALLFYARDEDASGPFLIIESEST